MMKRTQTIFALAMAILLFVTVMPITASAAEYSGKGTKKDPYIITTAEQLDGIRNKMSAHYKLGATIDMSGFGNFVSIGNSKTPFTGSLTCDVDENGKPVYAITNLTINLKAQGACLAEGWTGYKEDGSMGWQVGLFGKAKGATFENILLLNATVSSNVEGKTQMNSDFTANPTDHQATGGLVADGESIKVSGCGFTGTVTSSSNHTAGLIGKISGSSSVKNSYVIADVTATGMWGGGGFCGYIGSGSLVDSCCYNGKFTVSTSFSTHCGAFAGELDKTAEGKSKLITNCWSAGTVSSEKAGCFGGVNNHTSDTQAQPVEVSENTYTLSVIEGRTKAQTNKRVKNNNYITDQAGGLEVGFAAADAATVNAAFQDNAKWVITEGSYPQLKNVQMITAVEQLGTPKVEASPSEADDEGTTQKEVQFDMKVSSSVVKMSTQERMIVIVLGSVVGVIFIMAVLAIICMYKPTIIKKRTKTKESKVG